MECFWTWQSSSLVVVNDVLRCRWRFIKSCQLHISVTQEWLFGELETKFPFSADCLRVEGTQNTYQTACQVGGGAVSELYLDSCKTQARGLWRRYSKKWFNILRSPSDLFILQHFNAYQLHTHIFTLQSIISFPFISNVSFQAGQTMSWAQILQSLN